MTSDAPARPGYEPGVPAEIEPPTDSLIGYLETQVEQWGDATFCDFLGGTLTYREFGDQVEHAAFVLFVAGVRRGDRVSLVMPNCPQHMIAFYAAQRLGAIVSEHNPLATPEELEAQFALATPTVIIAWENSVPKITSGERVPGRTVFAVDLTHHFPLKSRLLLKLPIKAARAQREKLRAPVPDGIQSWEKAVAQKETVPHEVEHPDIDDTAVLIFTGGTTGTPKAVELTHRNLISNALQARAWLLPLRDGQETILAALPFFHAFGMTLGLTLALLLAAKIVIVPRFDVDLVLGAHKRTPLTFIGGVPPMFDRLEQKAREEGVDLSSVRFSVSGAMSLDKGIADRWESTTGGLLIEGYGMSECSPVIAGNPVNERRRPGTLGLPFPSVQVRLCDPETPTTPVAEGEVGEIQVKGPNVMRGYYNNPQATAETFTEDGWMRTGDLARQDEEGWLTMTDRLKEIIISGGFNIYPSQVEDAVRDMPGVLDVAVVGLPDASRGEQVVAALVMAPGESADLGAVRQWTERRISHYALPRQVAQMDELPRSVMGKVLRRKVSEQLQQAGERLGEVRAQAGERLGEARTHAGERLGELRAQAEERLEGARVQAEERLGELRAHRQEARAGRHARVTAEETSTKGTATAEDDAAAEEKLPTEAGASAEDTAAAEQTLPPAPHDEGSGRATQSLHDDGLNKGDAERG